MYFNNFIPAALFLASVTAKPLHAGKRQLGGLSPLLGVISQALPQGNGGTSAVPTASTLPAAGSGVTAQASCDKAVQRINDAIQLSSALTSKNGGKATTQDVLIVLAVLQKSLGESCNVANLPNTGSIPGSFSLPGSKRDTATENIAADGPLSGIIGNGGNPNGILGDITGGGRDDGDESHDGDDNRGCAEWDDPECADMYPDGPYYSGSGSVSRRESSTNVLQTRQTTALAGCTACEAALYSIVKQLQTLFKSAGTSTPFNFPGQPKLTAATQRLRMETLDTSLSEKRCDGTKC